MKQNGQDERFSGYGGIENTDLHCLHEAGEGWLVTQKCWLPEVSGFTQASLDPGVSNCTLVSITRVLCSLSGKGWNRIPKSPETVYPVVRDIGVRHGYDPSKSGLFRDLFVYTPFEIDEMVTEAWHAFGYPSGRGRNKYMGKYHAVRYDIDQGMPLLLSLTFGDYPGHTVTVTGYRTYTRSGSRPRHYIRVFDGWSEHVRYVDWSKARFIPANVTRFLPPK